MSKQQLHDEVLTLFVTGSETTAVSLSWIWYMLCQHPEVERTLHNEYVFIFCHSLTMFFEESLANQPNGRKGDPQPGATTQCHDASVTPGSLLGDELAVCAATGLRWSCQSGPRLVKRASGTQTDGNTP